MIYWAPLNFGCVGGLPFAGYCFLNLLERNHIIRVLFHRRPRLKTPQISLSEMKIGRTV